MADDDKPISPDEDEPVKRTTPDGRHYLERRDKVNGRFAKGHRPPGRKKGSFSGIKELRSLLDAIALEMSAPGGDIEKLVEFCRNQGPQGTWMILEKLVLPQLAAQQRLESKDDIADQEPITIIMHLEDPEKAAPVKHVESRVIDSNGSINGSH